jgi:L-amino acid N-acyltransferase YncA
MPQIVKNAIIVRPAEAEDIPAINAIYNYYVTETIVTFSVEPVPDAQALETYKTATSRGLLYLVAVGKITSEVLGYCYGVTFRGWKEAYKHTIEVSIFMHPDQTGKGVGSQLMAVYIDICQKVWEKPEEMRSWFGSEPVPIKSIILCMSVDEDEAKNRKMGYFQKQYGFKLVANFEKVGLKFGKW